MPKKPTAPARTGPPSPPRRWRLIAAVLGGLALLGGTTAVWRQHVRAERLAPLPAVPDLTRRPAELRERIERARNQIARGADETAALPELARLFHANAFSAEAEVCWRRLSERQPREARWRYYLADLCRLQADEPGLRQRLQETVALAPDYSPAWLELGELAFKSGELALAERAYRERLKLTPGDPYARLGLARLSLQAGRTADAEQQIREILRDTPDFPSVRNVYATLLAARGDTSGAEEQRWLGRMPGRFRKADDPWLLELRPHCFDSYQLAVWGSQEEQTGQPDRARALFERAIAVAPGDPVAYAELGQLLLTSGERAEALKVLQRGIQLTPFSEKLHLRLSTALRELGQAQAALENDQRGLAQAPESFEFLNSLGQSQAALNRFAEAEQSFRAALRISPRAPGPQVNLGLVFLKTGRRDDARRTLESALPANPGYPKLLVVLGGLALEDGRLDDAERLIRPHFQQHSGNSNARAMLTQLHLKRAVTALAAHDLASAARWCTAGLADVPDAAELLGLLGSIHLQNHDVPQALQAMEACQRLRPGDPRAVLPLAMLYKELQRPADARRVLIDARDWLRGKGSAELGGQIEAMLRTLPEN